MKITNTYFKKTLKVDNKKVGELIEKKRELKLKAKAKMVGIDYDQIKEKKMREEAIAMSIKDAGKVPTPESVGKQNSTF
jgi:hypothetical protein